MQEEFKRLYNLYKNDVLRLAFSYTKNLGDAEDITQNVFMKLYKHLGNFKDDNHVKKWCLIVTINECKNYFFSFWKRKICFLDDQKILESSSSNDENYVKCALLGLPAKERIIIYLYYYEGYRVKEIAQILKMNVNSVQTKLTRARRKLKDILKGEWEFEK